MLDNILTVIAAGVVLVVIGGEAWSFVLTWRDLKKKRESMPEEQRRYLALREAWEKRERPRHSITGAFVSWFTGKGRGD